METRKWVPAVCWKCGRVQGQSKLRFWLTRNTPDHTPKHVCDKHRIKRHYQRRELTPEQKMLKALNAYLNESLKGGN
jgi:DNA-directed RNA polymerase subunit N (RpoN/RPB10)